MRDFCFVLMTGNRKHIVVFVCLCRYLCHDTAGCICDTCISCVCDRFARLCIPIVRLWPVCLRVSICSIMHNARARACPLASADVWQRASLSLGPLSLSLSLQLIPYVVADHGRNRARGEQHAAQGCIPALLVIR